MEKKRNAIELEDVCIHYSIMNHTSIRKTFLHKKKRNEVFEAVKHVSFSVPEGDILGVIGKNGSGKSTLLKSIAGVFSPNSGTIDLKGHSVSLMSLGVGFKDLLSGRENIILSGMLLGFSEQEIAAKSEAIIDFAEIGDFIDRPVRTYSSGMYSKLAFSITAMLETDIMLVDEVLSVGDEQFKQKSLNKMKDLITDKKRTVIIVSHSLSTLQELCDQVLWLHDGEVRMHGQTDDVLKQYAEYMTFAKI
ncbi:MAG: ABC transporter ATP-binding protein [Lachnospiraceae bacterium]|nr:ABC transporter ATP-binding protein [Lachnospiraceae bacterium]